MPNAAKFRLGQVLITPGAMQALQESGQDADYFLARHVRGDWGQVCPEDAQLNDAALQDGSRILSAYSTLKGVKIRIITDAADDDGLRAATTILLPNEY